LLTPGCKQNTRAYYPQVSNQKWKAKRNPYHIVNPKVGLRNPAEKNSGQNW
jgi:hypothetical protein